MKTFNISVTDLNVSSFDKEVMTNFYLRCSNLFPNFKIVLIFIIVIDVLFLLFQLRFKEVRDFGVMVVCINLLFLGFLLINTNFLGFE